MLDLSSAGHGSLTQGHNSCFGGADACPPMPAHIMLRLQGLLCGKHFVASGHAWLQAYYHHPHLDCPERMHDPGREIRVNLVSLCLQCLPLYPQARKHRLALGQAKKAKAIAASAGADAATVAFLAAAAGVAESEAKRGAADAALTAAVSREGAAELGQAATSAAAKAAAAAVETARAAAEAARAAAAAARAAAAAAAAAAAGGRGRSEGDKQVSRPTPGSPMLFGFGPRIAHVGWVSARVVHF